MILLFDLGNSRAKWAAWAAGNYVHAGSVPMDGNHLADRLQEQLAAVAAPDRCLAASVSGAVPVARRAVDRLWGLAVEELESRAFQCGVRNAYADPAQLGVDRWLAMLAAWNRHRRAVCVLGLGTAATVDVINAEGVHLGGLIAPGLSLSRSVLVERTRGIHAAGANPVPELGKSTAECAANGCLLAVTGLVQSSLAILDRACGQGGLLVACGGDAAQVIPHLGVPCEHVPTLVFDGMLLAAGTG
jgi:type III pantothenate kinase